MLCCILQYMEVLYGTLRIMYIYIYIEREYNISGHGVVWYRVVWCGVVWCGVAGYGMVREAGYGMA